MNKILKVMCFILFALFAGIDTIYAQGQSPTGLVVDENGQPMIGVQIKIEGTTVGAITDVDGNFTIKAQKGNILLFSYVGYEQQKITYKGEKVLAIKMLPSTEMLAVPSLFNASLYRFNVSTEFMKVGRRVGSRIVPSARKEILGFCEFPRLEVIKITPFAPSAP